MPFTILFKRGLRSTLPSLKEGEPGFCTDTKEFFIGGSSGNVPIGSSIDASKITSGVLPVSRGGTGNTTGKPAAHTHTVGDISSFPTSLPANGGNADTATTATTATTLKTARKINGVNFDGSADITITAAANGGNADTVGGQSVTDIIANAAASGGGQVAIITGATAGTWVSRAITLPLPDGYTEKQCTFISGETVPILEGGGNSDSGYSTRYPSILRGVRTFTATTTSTIIYFVIGIK